MKEEAELEKQKPVLVLLELASIYRELYKDEYEVMFGKEKIAGADQIQEAFK